MLGCAAALFLLVFALFAPSIGFELVGLDDVDYLIGNRLVVHGLNGPALREAFSSFANVMYAPLLWVSYMADVSLFHASKSSPWGFHLVNVVFHTLNALLLFGLFRKWTGRTFWALLAVAVWAVHPLRVESVAWVSERKDVLSGFFFLLTLHAYGSIWSPWAAKSPVRRAWGWLAAFTAMTLGLLVKASLTPLPGVLLLMDFWPLRRCEWTWSDLRRRGGRLVLEKIPFGVLSLVASRLALVAHESFHAVGEMPLRERLLDVPLHYGFYLIKTILPRNLFPLYPLMGFSLVEWLAALVVLGGVTLWAWSVRRRAPEGWMGWLWFAGMLLPVAGLVRFGIQSVADRFMYLPAMGLSLALIPAAAGLTKRWPRGLTVSAAGVLLAVLCGLTARQMPHWKTTHSLTEHIGRFLPDHYSVYQQQAVDLLVASGDYAAARPLLEKALERLPVDVGSRLHLGICLCELESPDAAREYVRSCREQMIVRGDYEMQMAVFSYLGGHMEEARSWVEEGMRKTPAYAAEQNGFRLLAMAAAFRAGDAAASLRHAHAFPQWENLQEVTLADVFPLYAFFWDSFLRTEAAAYFLEVEEAYPARVDLLNNMAWLVAASTWSPLPPEVPLRMARRANELAGPQENAILLDTLGVALAHAGDFSAAVAATERALALTDSSSAASADFRKGLKTRLDLYREGKPYREESAARLF